MLIFGIRSTSDDQPGCSKDSNTICQPSPAKKMKCLSLYNIQHLMLARLVNGLKPHLPLSLAKKWNVHFWITFTLDDWPGWSMDSNPIHHPSPANKMKCFFLDYVHYWWSARLVNGLKPHLPPLSSQKNEMLIFGLCSTSDDWPGWLMDSNPIHHPLHPEKWNAHFWIMFNFWWLAELLDWLEPHPPPLSTQKHEMLVFV